MLRSLKFLSLKTLMQLEALRLMLKTFLIMFCYCFVWRFIQAAKRVSSNEGKLKHSVKQFNLLLMLTLAKTKWWGTSSIAIFLLCFTFFMFLSVVAFGRVFEFLSFRSEKNFQFQLFLLSEFIIHFRLNCEHEPVSLNKWKDPWMESFLPRSIYRII